MSRPAPSRQARPWVVGVALNPLGWVLALAAFFDGISDNWLHALLLGGAAGAVWWDSWRTAAGRPVADAAPLLARGPRWSVLLACCALAVAYAAVVGSFARYTWPITVAVLLPGTVALVVAWRGPVYDRVGPGPLSRTSVVGWTAVLVLSGLWELTALLMQPNLELGSIDHPTVSFMMDSVLAGHLGRTVTLLAWLALGWWLLSRAPSRAPGPQTRDRSAAT